MTWKILLLLVSTITDARFISCLLQVLLVSSNSNPNRWIIPGGKIQANEDPGTSAAREAMEEAGAQGRLGRSRGTFSNSDRKHRTTVFVLHVDPENGGLVDDFQEKVVSNGVIDIDGGIVF